MFFLPLLLLQESFLFAVDGFSSEIGLGAIKREHEERREKSNTGKMAFPPLLVSAAGRGRKINWENRRRKTTTKRA